MAPLGALWNELHKVQEQEGKAKLSGESMMTLIDQSVLLLGQVNNSLNFQRRQNVLTALYNDKMQATTILKENDENFQPSSSKLFGSKFEKILIKKAKSKKVSKTIMLEFRREKKPFRQGPSGRGASSSYTSNSSYRGRNDYNDKRGSYNNHTPSFRGGRGRSRGRGRGY